MEGGGAGGGTSEAVIKFMVSEGNRCSRRCYLIIELTEPDYRRHHEGVE